MRIAALAVAFAACAAVDARRPTPPPPPPAALPPLDPSTFPPLTIQSSTGELLYEGHRAERTRPGQRTFDLDGFGTLRIELKNGEIVACRATYEGQGFRALSIYETTFCNAGIAEAHMVCFDAADLPLVTGPKDAPHRALRIDGCLNLLSSTTE